MQVLSQYLIYKEIVGNLNSVTSIATISIFVASLPHYPIMLLDAIDGTDYISAVFMTITVGYISVAAEANRKVRVSLIT
jgi:hypothetical protein